MRINRIIVWLALSAALSLSACTKSQPPVSQSPPNTARETQQPPQQHPSPGRSPVTWEIVHIASGLKAPGGPVHLAPPYRFEVTFSAPVDRSGVEAALGQNAAEGTVKVVKWSSDKQLLLDMAPPAPNGEAMAAVDPTGGKDMEGRSLRVHDYPGFNFTAFTFWPAEATRVTRLDVKTGEFTVVARHQEPFQTVSVSPDGNRHLLRRHVLTPGQSVGITGTAYLFDLRSGTVAPLGVGGLFWHEWSNDGGLLVWGGCEEGPRCVVWVPPDPVAPVTSDRVGRLLFLPGPDESVASATISPDGRYAAVFAGKWGEPYAIHLFNGEGKPIRVLPKAAGVTQGPSGLTWVPAAWAPDGSVLAYGDGGTRREEREPMKIWLLSPEGGEQRLLNDNAGDIVSWSPKGDRLFVLNVGVVDREGTVLLAEPEGPAAWSPNGRCLFLRGAVYDTATWNVIWETPSHGPTYWAPDSQSIVVTGWSSDPAVGDGGLFRADGTRITTRYISSVRPLFSRNGTLVYLPDPDRAVQVPTGTVFLLNLNEPGVPGLGKNMPIAFTSDGGLLLALGHEWDR